MNAASDDNLRRELAALANGAPLPLPGAGQTLERWQALGRVAARDLSLIKLYEGYTDALAILRELGAPPPEAGTMWGVWAAEAPGRRLTIDGLDGELRVSGRKAWCSGARIVSHALVTAWDEAGNGPYLASVALRQPGVVVTDDGWQAVGMAASGSVEVVFDAAEARVIGESGSYLSRPGFWHGGAGIAACWYGATVALAEALHDAVRAGEAKDPLRAVALGRVDVALHQTSAVLRDAAGWIDAHPAADARELALRARLSAEATALEVLRLVTRATGPAPFCQDPRLARLVADLPIFVRQSGGERDQQQLGRLLAADVADWWL